MEASTNQEHSSGRVVVVGSINIDRVIHCAALPRSGETILATAAQTGFGGKGGNQAAAAACLGAQTWMIGAVGSDAEGAAAIGDLERYGVHVEHVRTIGDAATGSAIVLVDEYGDNCIVVVAGANAALEAAQVTESLDSLDLDETDVVLASAEISEDCVAAAAVGCARRGALLVYNLAPARALQPDTAARTGVLVVNEVEAVQVSGAADPAAALDALDERVAAVVMTRGAAGASVRRDGQHADVPAEIATVVDTTGAGDAWCGAFAAELAAGRDLTAATSTAVRAASLAVTGSGARGRLASRAEVTNRL